MRRIVLVLIVWAAAISAAAATDTTPAVVTGAQVLYVRRGPGVTYRAFATIERGEQVEVERLEGVWALVRLASGQTGYVYSTFLTFPGQAQTTLLVPATATSPRPPEPTATNRPEAASRLDKAQPSPEKPGDEAQPAPATVTGSSSSSGASPAELAALRSDVQRLTAAVDSLQKQIGEAPGQLGAGATEEHWWSSSTLGVMVLIALLVGWVIGSAYGRQSERSRRNRIRF
jgi:uncharacterized protein YgiM (DUF1202 family)